MTAKLGGLWLGTTACYCLMPSKGGTAAHLCDSVVLCQVVTVVSKAVVGGGVEALQADLRTEKKRHADRARESTISWIG